MSEFLIRCFKDVLSGMAVPVEVDGIICGVPGICSIQAKYNCFSVTLGKCEECEGAHLGIFVFFVSCMALLILFGNLLVMKVYHFNYIKRTLSKIDNFRVSLAVADLLTGFQIFFVTFPNLAWAEKSSLESIMAQQQSTLRNSASSVAGGFFYLLSHTSSLYHLLLVGIWRLYAITRPQQFRQMRSWVVKLGIGIVWILAVVIASVPAGWFPQYFSFNYNHVTFLFLPTLDLNSSTSYLPSMIWLTFSLIIPYVSMTLILFATAIMVRVQIRSSRKRLQRVAATSSSKDNSSASTFSKQEIAAFKTVALMQIGFTLTLIPAGIVFILLSTDALNCDTFSTPYLICIYLSMTNSLVNVLVYSVREKKFCTNVSDVFRNLRSNLSMGFSLSSSQVKTHKTDILLSNKRPTEEQTTKIQISRRSSDLPGPISAVDDRQT